MSKRIIALSIVLLLTFSLLAGCNGDNAETTTAAPTPTAAAATPAATDEPSGDDIEDTGLPLVDELTELNIWTNYSVDTVQYYDGPGETPWYAELEERTNVHVNWTIGVGSGNTYMEKLLIEINAGDIPYDAIVGLDRIYTGGQSSAYTDGLIVSLNDYLEYCPNYMAVLQSAPDIYEKNCKTDEGLYLAFERLYTLDNSQEGGMVIRQDWLDEISMELPQTIEEYYDVLKAFQVQLDADSAMWINKFGNLVGGPFGSAYDITSFFDVEQSSYMFYQVDGEVKFSPFEDGFKSYLQLLAGWYTEGLIYQDFISHGSTMNPPDDIIANNDCGIINTFIKRIPDFNEKSGGSWIGAYTPVLEKGQQTHFSSVMYIMPSWGTVICADSDNIELTCRFFDYFYSEDGQFFCNYGIEGLTWEDGSDGEPQLIPDKLFGSPEFNYNDTVAWYYYMCFDGSTTVNDASPRAAYYSDAQQQTADIWAYNTDGAYVMPNGVSMTTEENEQFRLILADSATLIQEYYCAAIMGEKNLEGDYDEFVAQLKSLGMDEAVACYQTALGRYNAR